MNENNELLLHIYKMADMGVNSTKKLLDLLKNKDNKIKGLLESELKQYEELLSKSEKMLKKFDLNPKGSSIVTEFMANMELMMDVKSDNSDANIAGLLMQGFTMGTIEMNKKISDYEKETDANVIKLARCALKFQEAEIEKLKKYL